VTKVLTGRMQKIVNNQSSIINHQSPARRNEIILGDCLSIMRGWPDGFIDMGITSPPYWGLRSYAWGGDPGCLAGGGDRPPRHKWADIDKVYQGCSCGARRPRYGLEPTVDEYIENTVEIFSEVRRVLKDWGTLWLNVGDAYAQDSKWGGATGGKHVSGLHGGGGVGRGKSKANLPDGNLIGLPWRVAFALQADGWYLRSAITWVKAWSFHDCGQERVEDVQTGLFGQEIVDVIDEGKSYVGSCMPESLSGWRWVRCRVKVKAGGTSGDPLETNRLGKGVDLRNAPEGWFAQWADCPGCLKCEANGGLILRKGSWRPTSASEMLFEFAKSREYYGDGEGVREAHVEPWRSTGKIESHGPKSIEAVKAGVNAGYGLVSNRPREYNPVGRNLRNVWCIQTQATSVPHYASFPEKLVEPCIKAGTSEKGVCPECGRPWARVIDHKQVMRYRPNAHVKYENGGPSGQPDQRVAGVANTTIGWRPTCECGPGEIAEASHGASREAKPAVPGASQARENLPASKAVVFDPFAGTNTVGVVAERLGRDWIGCEINPEYAQIAEKRMAKAPLLRK